MSDSALLTSPEAGPSRSPPRSPSPARQPAAHIHLSSDQQSSNSPTGREAPDNPDAETQKTLDATIRSKRRRASLFDSFSRQNSKSLPKATAVTSDPDAGRTEEEVLREQRVVDQNATDEIIRFEEEQMKGIEVFRGNGGQEAVIEEDIMEGLVDGKEGYVWDVLFENQRGIYLAGKAHFSSQSLLPMDPSPFTLPSYTLPSAQSFKVIEPASSTSNTEARNIKSDTTSPKNRAIKTAYTLGTFQTPSPAWTWVTPWMINMKTGSDEGGWRYNYYFKRKGWKSHAGTAGWGGWVRRREWVRLRALRPEPAVLQPPIQVEVTVEKKKTLGEVLEQDQESVRGLVKEVQGVMLDREKLHVWERWLNEGSERDRNKLQKVLDDEQAVHTLSKSFTHQSNFPHLLELFEAHHFTVPTSQQPHSRSMSQTSHQDPSDAASPSSSPRPDTPPSPVQPPNSTLPAVEDKSSASPGRDTDD